MNQRRKAVAAATALQGRLRRHERRPHRTPSRKTRLVAALPPCATTRVQITFSWPPTSARPFAVGGRLAVPSVQIAAEPGRVARRSRNQIVARPSWPCRSRAGWPCHVASRGTPRGCPCGGQAPGLPLLRDRVAQGVGGRLAAPLVPHSPCGTPGRASPTPTSRDCIHHFNRRLRLCNLEAATAISSWELTVGSSSKEKPGVTKPVTVAPTIKHLTCTV